jgi:Leucine-rich repeat (LRR) protein
MREENHNTVILQGTKLNGKEEFKFSRDATEIRISNQGLISIDLTPLNHYTSLQRLSLSRNQLQSLDLTPLSSCTGLQKLYLSDNQLQSLDLTPLNLCTRLQILELSDNRLQSLDLTPLSHCASLDTLILRGNLLQSIDLTPLYPCTNIQNLYLSRNQLQSVDLTPLSSCTSLQILYLSRNQLQSVDLAPLGFCTDLQVLELNDNRIHSIDLTPLSHCVVFQELYLARNQLQIIDLTPLSHCTNLLALEISHNQLQSIDLTPLSHCVPLSTLTLHRNCLQSIDLTPLSVCASIQTINLDDNPLRLIETLDWVSYNVDANFADLDDYDEIVRYDAPTLIQSLDLITQLVSVISKSGRKWKLLHLLHQALRVHGLGSLGFLDIDPQQQLEMVVRDDVNVEELKETMIGLLFQQIDRHGPTVGLDIKDVSQYTALAQRVETVIQNRKEELSRVKIPKTADGFDLRPLALTAYGFEVLTALRMNLTTDKEGLVHLQAKVRELGFELETTEDKDVPNPVQMSDSMKEYIWKLVDNNSHRQFNK